MYFIYTSKSTLRAVNGIVPNAQFYSDLGETFLFFSHSESDLPAHDGVSTTSSRRGNVWAVYEQIQHRHIIAVLCRAC